MASNAELYYRTMIRGGSASWNVRDRHMMETLDRPPKHHGPDAKAVVWEHNTHVGATPQQRHSLDHHQLTASSRAAPRISIDELAASPR